MKKQEIEINDLEAQQICFALEHEIKAIMRETHNSLEWIQYKIEQLTPIYYKFRQIMEN